MPRNKHVPNCRIDVYNVYGQYVESIITTIHYDRARKPTCLYNGGSYDVIRVGRSFVIKRDY